MPDLADLIQSLADKGELTHLSVISSGGGFSASYSPATTWGVGHGFDVDPVQAIHKAIEAAPKSKKVSRGLRVHPPVQAVHETGSIPVTEEPANLGPAALPAQADTPRPPSLMEFFNK